MLKKIGYGLILRVIPYVTAIPLLPLMRSDFTSLSPPVAGLSGQTVALTGRAG